MFTKASTNEKIDDQYKFYKNEKFHYLCWKVIVIYIR